jgi:hypothetical protein
VQNDFVPDNVVGGDLVGGNFIGGDLVHGDFIGGDTVGGNFIFFLHILGGDFVGGDFVGETFVSGALSSCSAENYNFPNTEQIWNLSLGNEHHQLSNISC